MTDISQKRHIAKTITWRIIASITTFIIAYLFFRDDAAAVEKAGGVALTESVIKMVLYYFHERVWYKSNFGLSSRRKERKEGGK